MLRTPYSTEDRLFSDGMHEKAQPDLYPRIYRTGRENLTFTTLAKEQSDILDMDMGIDRTVEVTVQGHGFRAPFIDRWQERFRRVENCRGKNDITITEWNGFSNLPSELYKICAGGFLYAKYDSQVERFTHAIAFHVYPTVMRIRDGRLPFSRGENKKKQTFIAIHVEDLLRQGLVQWIRWPEVMR